MAHDAGELLAVQKVSPEAWESTGPLIDHIISQYHRPLAVALPRFRRSLRKAADKATGRRCSTFATLMACWGEFQMDMAMQMMKEDGCLFPAIRRLERKRQLGTDPDSGAEAVRQRVRFAGADHAKTLELLTQIRQFLSVVCNGETPCAAPLSESFDRIDHHIRFRIHLQDKVLFPMIEAAC